MKQVGMVLLVLAFLAIGAWLIMRSNAEDKALNSLSDCVVKTAQAQHYAGNPYSEEAWNLFAPSCAK